MNYKKLQTADIVRLLYWIFPITSAVVGLMFINQYFDAPVQVDPTYTYLPAARALLSQGWSFLLTPQSYEVTPLAYMWPALWGVEPKVIRLANAGLWISCVFFLWRTSCLLGGLRAGIVAMLLLLSPELVRYFPSEMTEPLFLFGLFGWMYSMARMIIGREYSVSIVLLGSFTLTTTLLSRPVLQLIAPAILFACFATLTYWKIRNKQNILEEWHPTLLAIIWSIGVGLILPIALIIKNGIVFDLWGLGTGSGTGLYLGTHPLFQGAEPPFLGFNYDINSLISILTNTSNHLSIAGDRIARDAAISQIMSMDGKSAAIFFSHKLWWLLAHHPAQVDFYGKSLRTFRLVELSLILVVAFITLASWRCRKLKEFLKSIGTPRQLCFALFILLMFAAMVAQLLPILYNSRYSSNLLDPWIIPLAAFSLSALLAPVKFSNFLTRSRWDFSISRNDGASLLQLPIALSMILVVGLATHHIAKKIETVSVDSTHMGSTKNYLEIDDDTRIITYGMTSVGDKEWQAVESPFSFQVSVSSEEAKRITQANIFNALWDTELSVKSPNKKCDRGEVSYQMATGEILQPANKLSILPKFAMNDHFQHIVTHANQELRPTASGSLRIVLHCPIGTTVRWRATRLLESRHFADVAQQLKTRHTQ